MKAREGGKIVTVRPQGRFKADNGTALAAAGSLGTSGCENFSATEAGLLAEGAAISLAMFPFLFIIVVVQLLYIRRVETR